MKIYIESTNTDSKRIVEAFDPSLPDWLKQAVSSGEIGRTAQHSVSWDTAVYTQAEPPQSAIAFGKYSKDAPFRIPIYYLNTNTIGYDGKNKKGTTVYIPGMNNPEIMGEFGYGYSSRTGRPNYKNKTPESQSQDYKAPYSVWKNQIIEFGWLSKVEVSTAKKRNIRDQSKKGVERRFKELPAGQRSYNHNMVDQFGRTDSSDYNKFDKSGYRIENPARYAKMIKDRAQSKQDEKAAESLQNVYTRLIELKDIIINKYTNNKNSDNLDFATSTLNIPRSIENDYKSAISEYRYAIKYLEEVMSSKGNWVSTRDRLISRLSSANDYILSLEEMLNNDRLN